MFDVAPTELIVLGTVALLVIPPKDLPRAMRTAGYWVGRARGVARQFRSGFDNIVREAELEEMEKRWRAENERIMREHPAATAPDPATPHDDTAAPLMTPRPDGAHDAGEIAPHAVAVEHPVLAPAGDGDVTAPVPHASASVDGKAPS